MTAATHMLPRDMQETNERRFSKRHIDEYLDTEIRNHPETEAQVHDGVQRLQTWLGKFYYETKNTRLAQLQGVDLEEIVRTIFINVAYCQLPELFTSVTGQLAGALKMSEKAHGIITIGEMLAVLCLTDAFDIIKADRSASLVIQSRIPLSDRLLTFVHQTRYLPPMVCEPEELTTNHQSPYLTHNDSLVLGAGNSHSEDICLDVINIQNKVALSLDLEFLCTREEEPSKPITVEAIQARALKDNVHLTRPQAAQLMREQQDAWDRFKSQSYETYHLLATQGNAFWLTHKVDKRGRIYASGYHVTTQGSPFKKASINFAKKEIVSGVPVA